MYILIIARGYPTDKYLLNGIFEFDQAKALQSAGCDIVYASIDLKSIRRIRRWGIKTFRKDGINVAEISWPIGGLKEKSFDYFGKRAVKRLYKYIVKRYGHPALVHAHFLDYAVLSADLCVHEQLPFVITEHYSKMNHDVVDDHTKERAKYAFSLSEKKKRLRLFDLIVPLRVGRSFRRERREVQTPPLCEFRLPVEFG